MPQLSEPGNRPSAENQPRPSVITRFIRGNARAYRVGYMLPEGWRFSSQQGRPWPPSACVWMVPGIYRG